MVKAESQTTIRELVFSYDNIAEQREHEDAMASHGWVVIDHFEGSKALKIVSKFKNKEVLQW